MKSLHLTIMVFCHVLLASVIFYFTSSIALASPIAAPSAPVAAAAVEPAATVSHIQAKKDEPAAHPKPSQKLDSIPVSKLEAKSGAAPVIAPVVAPVPVIPPKPVVVAPVSAPAAPSAPVAVAPVPIKKQESSPVVPPAIQVAAPIAEPSVVVPVVQQKPASIIEGKSAPIKAESEKKEPAAAIEQKVITKKSEETQLKERKEPIADAMDKKQSVAAEVSEKSFSAPKEAEKKILEARKLEEPAVMPSVVPKPEALVSASSVEMVPSKKEALVEPRSQPAKIEAASVPVEQPQAAIKPISAIEKSSPISELDSKQQLSAKKDAPSPKLEQEQMKPVRSGASVVTVMEPKESQLKGKISSEPSPISVQPAPIQSSSSSSSSKPAPAVNGGLGPLHLLATTLCSYQADRPVADDSINQLYARRAIVRKSLFDFMSLKFTNLEKLSSRLGYGLQVVPVKSVPEVSGVSGQVAKPPSHGWPVVGKCTAHDLKLMGEAAWCECNEGDQDCSKQPAAAAPSQPAVAAPADPMAAPMVPEQNKAVKAQPLDKQKSARSIATTDSFSPEQSSVISKILHVGNVKDAPVVESNFYNLNLTQHQLATLEAQATSTQECRRNALRYSKALFQHLAEDQQSRSDSWPKLYAQIQSDDCARKRMIDIINALSSFRTDTTSIRRDNVEFAFAMDDLRTKVLENEVNVPLTFDRHFIEVEQFLQQSVRLMLSSVQPKKAKLTTMRYRSLMYGAVPSIDEQQQCIDLHQRLLVKNYPNDCNPTQFGQLPDVLRMTANSLELWSIEKELSLYLSKIADYPNSNAVGQQKVREDVNECIANLVAS